MGHPDIPALFPRDTGILLIKTFSSPPSLFFSVFSVHKKRRKYWAPLSRLKYSLFLPQYMKFSPYFHFLLPFFRPFLQLLSPLAVSLDSRRGQLEYSGFGFDLPPTNSPPSFLVKPRRPPSPHVKGRPPSPVGRAGKLPTDSPRGNPFSPQLRAFVRLVS